MIEAPIFFVPFATPEIQESVYVSFANWCHVSVPPLEKRIYSIEFWHDGEIWTATVGESLHGVKTESSVIRRGKKIERTVSVSDPATVLAIFPGNSYTVVILQGVGENNVGSKWANPFLAGSPKAIKYFNNDQCLANSIDNPENG